MLKTGLIRMGIALLAVGSLCAANPQRVTPVSSHGAPHRAILDRYCVTCHNQQARTAGLVLNTLDVEQVGEGAAVWEKVLRKLRSRAMPPAGMPRPQESDYDALADYLEGELDRAASEDPNPGSPVLHRLNRAEYANAVRDLLALEIDAGSILPPDDSGYGFDNIGEVLSVSPMLVGRYMSAGRKVSRQAVGDPGVRPDVFTFQVPLYLRQQERTSPALPLGSRGISFEHYFPVDGEYAIEVALKSNYSGIIFGVVEEHQVDFLLDRDRIGQFMVGGQGIDISQNFNVNGLTGPDAERADAGLRMRLPLTAGPHSVGIAFLKETFAREQLIRPIYGSREALEPNVGTVTIRGPFNVTGAGDTPSRSQLFVCRPAAGEDEEPCAREILSRLARRAYRRPVGEDDIQTLLAFFDRGRSDGGFEKGIETALQRILVSPEFLFRIERDPEDAVDGSSHRINDLELASRLSFFLWSSIPDEELLSAAERGELSKPQVLEAQVQRMLRDPKSQALVQNFAGQWLYLRNVSSAVTDQGEFPEFDDNLRRALQKEAELFFESVLKEDRSLIDLLDADYTFLNERLAQHYGIPNIYGSHFRRVTLESDERRGLLGKGGIQLVTSYGNRTSPVLRGKWVLQNLLGTPPPAPPPDVPALEETSGEGKPMSMRQRMEQHRANPTCASCHARMDPLGFALENFNAIGKWRDTESGIPIDTSGVLPDGTQFDGPSGLREVLLARRQEFVLNVTEKLMTYALGRGVEYYDAPSIRDILAEAAPHDYRWSSVVMGIVKSTPFQMRRSIEKP